jgi:YidC/Oxa1 family membrane protein insertase
VEPNDRSRSLTTIAIAGAGFMLVYYGSQWLFGPPTPPATESAETATEEVSPEEQARRDEEIAAAQAARVGRRTEGTIHTPLFEAGIDNLGGGITHFRLLGDRFHDETGEQHELVTTDREEYRPLRISLPGAPIPADAVWDLRQVSETEVELRWRGEGLEVVRSFSAGQGPYQVYQTVVVRNIGDEARRTRLNVHAYHYVERANEGSSTFGARSPYMSEGLCRHEEEVERKDRTALLTPHGYGNGVDFVAVESVYFVQALAASSEPAARCGLVSRDLGIDESGEALGSIFEGTLQYETVEIAPGAEHSWTTLAYLGPKDWRALGAAGHYLSDVVNLGTFAIIARAFAEALEWLYRHVGNWGLAIIILTLIVKLLLFPIVNRQYRMMAPMRKLKPEMDKISAEYKDDMEKRQAATMELYRRHGINPAAQMMGCLPVFLQMPVFFALYTSLSTNVELYHQPFIWPWVDLSARDPYFILPVLLSALMFVQQKLMPNTMDPQQAKIMLYMMPLMMGMFMLFLPSGLCLYMLTNSALSIAQQQLNFWRANREDAERDAAAAAAVKNTTPAVEEKSPKASGRTGSKSSGRTRNG